MPIKKRATKHKYRGTAFIQVSIVFTTSQRLISQAKNLATKTHSPGLDDLNVVSILPKLVTISVGNLQLSNHAVFLVDSMRANAALPVAPCAVGDGHLVDVLAVLAAPLGVVVTDGLGDCRHFV